MIIPRPPGTIEQRIADLEAQLRSRTAGDQPIYDPTSGAYVPLALLAFGRRSASRAGVVNLSTNDGTFYADPDGLEVWAEVFRGQLLVEAAARLVVSGNKATMAMSWTVEGPYAADNDTTALIPGVTPATIPGSVDRALSVLMDNTGQSQSLGAGFPFTHTGLTPGWYRVRPVYNLQGAVGQPNGITGSATARTIIADPR